MAREQIHELEPVSALSWSDLTVVSTAAGNLTRSAPLALLADRLVDDRLSVATPEHFGTPDDGTSPASAGIQAAIDAIHASGRGGILYLPGTYALDTTIELKRGVKLLGTNGFNRRTLPNEFNAGVLRPHPSMSAGSTLLDVGQLGQAATNPNGTLIEGICIDGRLDTPGRPHLTGAIGIHIRDTSDVHLLGCYVGGFDRTSATGIGVRVTGQTEGSAYGFEMLMCVISNNWAGVVITGVGATDIRVSQNLFLGNTRGVSLGFHTEGGDINLGGGGGQFVNNHYTYTGMPGTGWHFRNGAQAGDLMISNEYFDQGGDAYVVRLGNGRAIINGCHFLVAPACAREGLIRLTTGGSQQLTVTSCNANLNNSSVQGLVWYSAKSGIPTGGVIASNVIFGTSSGDAWLAHALDSAGQVIEPMQTSTFVNINNVRCP